MEFKDDNKVIISTMSVGEARSFLKFLQSERMRHEEEMRSCQFIAGDAAYNDPAYRRFYESAVKRHRKDITDIDDLTDRVKEMFRL